MIHHLLLLPIRKSSSRKSTFFFVIVVDSNLLLVCVSSMATLLESVVLPTPISISSNLSAPMTMMISSSSSNTRKLKCLPQFNGLKMQFGCSTQSVVSVKLKNRRISGSGGGVVCEAQETAVGVPAVAEATWESLVLESDLPVLVEFWAPWCGPCRMIHPVIDELAKEYLGKMKCFKLNTDESPKIATQYGIRSIPTVMLFKKGEKKDAVIGAVPKSTLTTSIEKFL